MPDYPFLWITVWEMIRFWSPLSRRMIACFMDWMVTELAQSHFKSCPGGCLQVHLDSNGTMDVDLISEEPRVWGPACWRRNIAHVSWVLVGAASRDASKQLPKNPQERLSAVCLQGTESMKPPTPARLPFRVLSPGQPILFDVYEVWGSR